jgi:hypothetical protein
MRLRSGHIAPDMQARRREGVITFLAWIGAPARRGVRRPVPRPLHGAGRLKYVARPPRVGERARRRNLWGEYARVGFDG